MCGCGGGQQLIYTMCVQMPTEASDHREVELQAVVSHHVMLGIKFRSLKDHKVCVIMEPFLQANFKILNKQKQHSLW